MHHGAQRRLLQMHELRRHQRLLLRGRSMKVTLVHHRGELKNGRWIAEFSLDFRHGSELILSRQCFDPRIDLTFESDEQARERNRLLALNWKQKNSPDVELYERA